MCHTHGRGGHYHTEEVTRSDSKATSVACYQKRSYYREKVSKRGLNPDMTEGIVAITTFNASYQTSWLHLCGKDS